MEINLTDMLKRTNAYECLECGKCTSICPVSRANRQYSPRTMLTRAIRSDLSALFEDYNLWSCLTCKKCDEYCPMDIRYIQVMKYLRASANESGFNGKCSHSGAIHALQRIMTADSLNQNRLGWVDSNLNISKKKGDILYFAGCAPYFDVFFSDIDADLLAPVKSSISILNKLGIKPVVMPDERCCGHDLIWSGDHENFKQLAEHNTKCINETGASTILFSCAECLSVFKQIYPEYGFRISAKMLHMSEFIAEKVSNGEISLKPDKASITYQDPCRLGRHLNIYDEPRQLLNAGEPAEYVEMMENQQRSLCCGVSAWMNCDVHTKAIQVRRLNQAKATGARTLAVACPKCRIHLSCTLKDKKIREEIPIEIRDITEIIHQWMD